MKLTIKNLKNNHHHKMEEKKEDGKTLKFCKRHGWLEKNEENFVVKFNKNPLVVCRHCLRLTWRKAVDKRRKIKCK